MAFATADDVATRLGRTLTSDEDAAATAVCELVSGLIADAVGQDEGWVETVDPVPAILQALCIEKALSAVVNPNSFASFSEQLGSYQRSGTYPRSSDIGLFLSRDEERRVRRVVFGTTFVSQRVGPNANDYTLGS